LGSPKSRFTCSENGMYDTTASESFRKAFPFPTGSWRVVVSLGSGMADFSMCLRNCLKRHRDRHSSRGLKEFSASRIMSYCLRVTRIRPSRNPKHKNSRRVANPSSGRSDVLESLCHLMGTRRTQFLLTERRHCTPLRRTRVGFLCLGQTGVCPPQPHRRLHGQSHASRRSSSLAVLEDE